MSQCSWMSSPECIRGWKLSQHLTQSLTLNPLEQALRQSVPEIHHSDQGVQYLSSAYISTLKRHGIEISLARRGCPWENGYAERLIRTLKEEEVHLNDYKDAHGGERSHRAFYHTGVSPKTPAFGVRVFDTYRISKTKLVLTLLIFGLNKRWHFSLTYNKKDMYDHAIADCSKAIEIDPNSVVSYSNRGFAYNGKGMYDHAIADCSKAIEIDPNYSSAYNTRGVVYIGKEEYDLAIADFDKCISLNPSYMIARENRAVAILLKECKK